MGGNTNSSFIQLPSDVTNPMELRRFLDKLVQQLDVAFGNRGDSSFATNDNFLSGVGSIQELIDAINAEALKYSKLDGSREYSGIVSYSEDKVFINDRNLISKKYSDDQDTILETALDYKIDLNTQAIANLATAQGSVEGTQTDNYVFDPIPGTFAQLPIDLITQSTDTDIFEINEATNTITFKSNASFNCHNSMMVEAGTPNERTIHLQIVDVSDDAVVYEREATVQNSNGSTANLEMISLLTIGKEGFPSAPVTLRMDLMEATSDYSLISFNSLIASSSSYDIGDFTNNPIQDPEADLNQTIELLETELSSDYGVVVDMSDLDSTPLTEQIQAISDKYDALLAKLRLANIIDV